MNLELFDELTDGGRRPLRMAELVYGAAERDSSLPSRSEIDEERTHPQKEKRGLEIKQGEFFAEILGDQRRGQQLMDVMRGPKPESSRRVNEFRRTGHVDLGTNEVRRRGRVGWIELKNLSCLNAEDDISTANLEVAVDLVLLDPEIDAGVLRGAPMTHPKHQGRHIFGSGINLTDLYYGRISLVEFMLERELGYVHKIFRGLLADDGSSIDKPFLAAVESWAIGGACQWLLVMDAVIAERGSYFSLPARKEGIIPGCANLRLPRFIGERAAREAIFFNRQFDADSADGRLIADAVVDAEDIESTVEHMATELGAAGPTSLVANRRALRDAYEPQDVFRRYMAAYSLDQARCLYSPALIDNLERNWNAKQRREAER